MRSTRVRRGEFVHLTLKALRSRRGTVGLLLVGITLLVIGHAMTGVFGNFSRGVITKAQMIYYMQRGLLVAALMYVILSVF